MAKKIKIKKKTKKELFEDLYKKVPKLQGGLDAKNLKNKPVKDILKTIQDSGLNSTAASTLVNDLYNMGYPYKGTVETKDGKTSVGFQRQVEGYSKNWINTKKNSDGSVGGYSYGIRYSDGGYENIPKERFDKEVKKFKSSKDKIYVPITDKSDAYTKLPELANGIDTIDTYRREMETDFKDVATAPPEDTKTTATTTTKGAESTGAVKGREEVGSKTGDSSVPYKEIGNMAGDLVEVIDPQKNGKKSVAGEALKGAGQGAAVGAMLGGPVGAAIGGVVGGGISAIKSITTNKKIDAQIKEQEKREQSAQILKTIQPAKNTQAPMYEEGTIAASMTQPVEVEKDEIVLRKNNKGTYYVVADFKNGKTHAEGGEDFVIQEGDIVFPGKKRRTILNHIKNNNMAGIESERLKLPKDVPNTNKLEDGIDKYGKTAWLTHRSRILTSLSPSDREKIRKLREPLIKKQEEEIAKIHEELKKKIDSGELTEEEAEKEGTKKFNEVYRKTNEAIDRVYRKEFPEFDAFYKKFAPPTDLDMYELGVQTRDLGKDLEFKGIEQKSPFEGMPTVEGNNMSTPNWLQDDDKGFPIGYTSAWRPDMIDPNSEIIKYAKNKPIKDQAIESTKIKDNKISGTKKADELEPIEGLNSPKLEDTDISNIGRTLVNISTADDIIGDNNEESNNNNSNESNREFKDIASEAMRYTPAVSNILKGFQAPETVERRFYVPETFQYKDMSEGLRQEANLQRRIESENAARFSGGSAQVSRAGKSMAGSRWFKRRQAINEAEAQRAQAIEAQNVANRNQARLINLQLANKYDELDAQNRAAIDAYFDQGLYDFGRISNQIERDRKMKRRDEMILNLIETSDFKYDKDGNKIKYKG